MKLYYDSTLKTIVIGNDYYPVGSCIIRFSDDEDYIFISSTTIRDKNFLNKKLITTIVNENGTPYINKADILTKLGSDVFSPIVEIGDSSGNKVSIDESGQMHIVAEGDVSDVNSTSETLNAGIEFTGEGVDTLKYAVITVIVKSDKVSATDGLKVEFSPDNINWDGSDEYTIPAVTGKTFSFQPQARYMRVRYINGGEDQTYFRLQTIMKKTYVKPSSHRIADSIIDDDDAELVTNVNKAKDDNGDYVNIGATVSGNLKIANVEDGLSIAKGDVVGTTFIHKFGAAPDFDTGDNEVTVWDGAEDGTLWENMVYDYSLIADIDSISSSNELADVGLNMEIQGLDTNYNIVLQTISLDGVDARTRVALTTPLIRVFRIKNISNTNLTGHVFVYPNTAISGGIPTDKSKIRAVIHPENNQTEMAIFTVPAGKTGYLRSWYAAEAGANKVTNYIIKLKARSLNGVFQLKHKSAISTTGTSQIQHEYVEPEIFQEKTDIEMTTQITAVGVTGGSVAAGFDIVLIDN
jgi:hypothetical protein